MKLTKLHFALFYSSLNISNKLQLATQISEKTGKFDGEPLILPVPEDAPSDVPRIILKDSIESLQLVISKSRTDFPIKIEADFSEFSPIATSYIDVIQSVYNIMKPTLVKLGIVLEFSDLKDDSIDYISKNFLKEKIEKEEINLATRDIVQIDDKKTNVWFRIQNNPDDKDNKSIIYTFDINTVNNEEYTFDNCMDFFSKAIEFITNKNNNYIK